MKPILTAEQAAAARREAAVARSLAPAQRRCSSLAEAPERGYNDRASLQIRAAEGSTSLHFTGYASAYERAYQMWDFFGPYDEIVTAGAGADSLNRVDLDVPLVLQHQQLRRLARTVSGNLFLSEDDTGLLVDAPSLDPADQDVAYIAPKLRQGPNGEPPLIDEMSFAFRITEGVWSPDFTQYRINSYDIHRGDVAIVGYGANPFTTGSLRAVPDVRSLLREASDEEARAALGDLLQRFPRRRARQPVEPMLPRVI